MIKHRYNWQLNRQKGNILNFRVSWNSGHCACKFSTGFRIDETKWSNDTQRCRANTTHPDNIPAVVINRRISEYENIADNIFLDFFERKEVPSVETFKDAFNKATGKTQKTDTFNKEDSVIYLYNKFMSIVSVQNNWADGTLKKFWTLEHHLKEFNKKLTLDMLDKDFMHHFYEYFIRNGYNNNTIKTRFRSLKQFIHWLETNDLYSGNARRYSIRLKGISDNIVVYLTWDELLSLYSMPIAVPYLERTRDVFCFCCFTSLRYSDVSKLQRSDIKNNCIEVVTQKTIEPLSIDLNDYSRSILAKYEHEHFPDGLALPIVSNQRMNHYLKELAKLAKLDTPIKKVSYTGSQRVEKVYKKWELITTHCGRRTFIVNALYLGIPAEVVMKWTGHADYESMRPYIAIVDDLKSREMEKFNTGIRK